MVNLQGDIFVYNDLPRLQINLIRRSPTMSFVRFADDSIRRQIPQPRIYRYFCRTTILYVEL
jgi:hypothetical protein